MVPRLVSGRLRLQQPIGTMSTAARLKQKHSQSEPALSQVQPGPESSGRPKIFAPPPHTPEQESLYAQYQPLKEANPLGLEFSMQSFPHTFEMHKTVSLPLSLSFCPVLSSENQAEVMEKNLDAVPRCGQCTAYMNCYNTQEDNNKKFKCFFCGSVNYTGSEYIETQVQKSELQSSIYQAYSEDNFYRAIPTEQCFVFMIDVSAEASECQMLHYAVPAMKELLSRPELDNHSVYFYTYDEVVHEYDMAGQELVRRVVDISIQETLRGRGWGAEKLAHCRGHVMDLLDELVEISRSNSRDASRFTQCFEYVYQNTKGLGAKYFILQANQNIGGEFFISEEPIMRAGGGSVRIENPIAPKSLYDSRNKMFYEKYTKDFLNNYNSFSFFFFAKSYKNLKVFSDSCKFTNSEIKYYCKGKEHELLRFYYELSYFLGCTYYREVFVELLISEGWQFISVHGNVFRHSNNIILYSANQVDPSKVMTVLVNPIKGFYPVPPKLAVQIVTHYRYGQGSYASVATLVQTLTGYHQNLYEGVDTTECVGPVVKGILNHLRLDTSQAAMRNLVDVAARIYQNALRVYKTKDKLPDSIFSFLVAMLSLTKSAHMHPQIFNKSPMFDRVISERNLIACCNNKVLATWCQPYLFDLSELDEQLGSGEDFAYPPTVEIRFSRTKVGIFLLDDGFRLFIFIAKQHSGQTLKLLLGREKFSKTEQITEDLLNSQTNGYAKYVQKLIEVLRGQKIYGWAPLYIVRCGENSESERDFYLKFTQQKYDEFKVYKNSIEQYLQMLRNTKVEA